MIGWAYALCCRSNADIHFMSVRLPTVVLFFFGKCSSVCMVVFRLQRIHIVCTYITRLQFQFELESIHLSLHSPTKYVPNIRLWATEIFIPEYLLCSIFTSSQHTYCMLSSSVRSTIASLAKQFPSSANLPLTLAVFLFFSLSLLRLPLFLLVVVRVRCVKATM